MSAPHNWLKAAIEAASGVTAWPVEMTGGGEPPYVVYERSATTRNDFLGDPPGVQSTPSVATFSVMIYADSYAQAWDISHSITDAIHNFQGIAHGATITHCIVQDERDSDAVFVEGREQPTFAVELVVEILFQE